ncbi:MAG: bifunctional oligoribonuclease/PAP phosphatase NrnA [Candidatus Latescibacterota bacterium]
MWDQVKEFINKHNTFLLTTHINPEGDAIGSEVALKAFLESLGKRVFVVNSSETPRNCLFLDPNSEILIYPGGFRAEIMDEVDCIIIVDVNSWDHVGGLHEVLQASAIPRICIDHHQGDNNGFVDVFVCDTSAASAGVLIYELIKHMHGEITRQITEALYVSLITDTGTFRFTNTDARTFTIAADLYDHGADPFQLHRYIFANRSWGAARLMGTVLNTVESAAGGKLVWIRATREMFENASAIYEDSDGILEHVRGIIGVELCLFFKETSTGRVKVSVRSNGKVNAYLIAKHHGGGGHKMASGIDVDGPMDLAVQKVIATCLELSELQG